MRYPMLFYHASEPIYDNIQNSKKRIQCPLLGNISNYITEEINNKKSKKRVYS